MKGEGKTEVKEGDEEGVDKVVITKRGQGDYILRVPT